MPQRIDFAERELTPGALLLHHRSKKWKTEAFRVFLAAPLGEGVAERSLAAYLMRHGHSRLRGMEAVSRRMQDLFGATFTTFVSKSNERHLLALRGIVIAADLVPGKSDPLVSLFEYLDRLLTKPWFASRGFADSVFERERTNLIRAIDAIKDQKGQYAEQRLIEEMFAGHPFARPAYGHRDEVLKARREDVIAEYHRLVAEAPLLLYVVSPRSTREIETLLKRSLTIGPRKPLGPVRVKPPEIRTRPRRVAETDDLVQGRLAMGLRCVDYRRSRDVHAAVLADMLFGGSSSSRLFKEVREKRSLAYSIHSSLDPGTGSSIVSAGVDPGNIRAVEKLVMAQLAAIAAGRFERSDLDTVLMTIKKQLESIGDSPDAMINFHSGRRLGMRHDTDPAALFERYRRIKPERIAEQASRLVLDTVYSLKPAEVAR